MSAPGFAHEALVYRDEPTYVDAAASFAREGLLAGEAVFAILPPAGAKLLRESLVDLADPDVVVVDACEVGRNPARLIPAIRARVTEAGDRPVRGVVESTWPGRTEAERAEVVLHEALVNLAFEETTTLRLRCLFDGSALPEDLLTAVAHTHPVVTDGVRAVSTHFDHDYAHDRFDTDLPTPTDVTDVVHFCIDDLPELRDLVTVRAKQFGLPRDRALDLTLATNEIVTNSICHGGERGTLRLWTDTDTLICEITDSGHIPNPLVGRLAPLPAIQGGRGIWLANQLCDLVTIRSHTPQGTATRLHVRR
ncbi:sensor histidine kinase [Actinokineospora globicatena]|uniref:sensor histidine kinase n=1 Tax=Actinokineospora globicatena TaxID=103729 RepID=UPI0020A25203|nr:sensor histidine kinase [Actinokineospora globicatena]MCP2306621.1 Anti-sigma regulatory factor (Ser/Thr protein kinase) [Actinokineospora globicatena]GLW82263.1 anti-sigma regulatory factor [Actinokineospora globicatena]GLW89055.1 anti-sigma regulatory factor [Actinokineospora globicatena]